jgi:hypothetical protein
MTRELVNAVCDALSLLPWSGSIDGFSEEGEIIHLHKYTTTDWLGTVHENQMLDLLSYDITAHSISAIIQPTHFIPSLF